MTEIPILNPGGWCVVARHWDGETERPLYVLASQPRAHRARPRLAQLLRFTSGPAAYLWRVSRVRRDGTAAPLGWIGADWRLAGEGRGFPHGFASWGAAAADLGRVAAIAAEARAMT